MLPLKGLDELACGSMQTVHNLLSPFEKWDPNNGRGSSDR